MADDELSAATPREAILSLVGARGPGSSICPSEAARRVGGADWRAWMEPVRTAARSLAREGRVEITQRGAAVDPDAAWRGPIRIRAKRA
ncbi:MAG: DUF3253 domain-containing protein [Mycobacterium sp.]